MTTYHQIIQQIYQKYIWEHTQKLIQNQYTQYEDFQRLLQPLQDWQNKDYYTLSALTDISASTLKRILGYSSSTQLSSENELKIIKYLGYENKLSFFTQKLLAQAHQISLELE